MLALSGVWGVAWGLTGGFTPVRALAGSLGLLAVCVGFVLATEEMFDNAGASRPQRRRS